MSKNFYTFDNTVFLEKIINYAILPTVRYHICQLLYSSEMDETYFDTYYQQTYPIAFKRFVLADISANPDSAMKKRDKIIKTNNYTFPFTAYDIGEIEEDLTNINHNAKSYNYIINELGVKTGVRPLKFEIPMISFFSTSHDYYYALSKLHDNNMSYNRLYAPISINDDVVYIPFDFMMEITKGQYADEFEEQLRTGRIQDIVHTGSISFMDFTFLDPLSDDNDGRGRVYPIENIIYYINDYYDKINLDQNTNIDSFTIDNSDLIISCNVSGQSDILVDTNVVFTFSERMNTVSFIDNIVSIPKLFYVEEWNVDETELTLNLYENMNSGESYFISLSEDILTYSGSKKLEEDYEIEFNTV